jgi:hypothetical protein
MSTLAASTKTSSFSAESLLGSLFQRPGSSAEAAFLSAEDGPAQIEAAAQVARVFAAIPDAARRNKAYQAIEPVLMQDSAAVNQGAIPLGVLARTLGPNAVFSFAVKAQNFIYAPSSRETAINALGEALAEGNGANNTTRLQEAVQGILASASNESEDVRFQVVHALGKIARGNENLDTGALKKIMYQLVTYWDDKDEFVRGGAVKYLSEIKGRFEPKDREKVEAALQANKDKFNKTWLEKLLEQKHTA